MLNAQRRDIMGGGGGGYRAVPYSRFFPQKSLVLFSFFFLFFKNPQRQVFPAFLPDLSQSRSVVGDIRKNGQNFSDLNFHKI